MTRNATITIITFLALALLAFAQGATAYVGPGQSLNATLLYYEPVPAGPGDVVDVYVQIENTGSSSAKVQVAFVDTFPFSVDTETDRIKTTPSIPSQENFLVKYRVRVSPEAEPGVNYLKVEYYTDPATTQSALLPITVYSSDVSLAIEQVSVSPETIAPGSVGKVSVTVRNDARLSITDGYLQLMFSGLDIVPYGTTDQQRLTGLSGGVSRTYEFPIIPSPSLEPGVYSLPMVLNFTDQRGTKRTITQTIGLRIGAVPDVGVTLDDVSVAQGKDAIDLIVRVTNKGLGEIKFATLTLGDAEGYSVRSGGSEKYVGNIDSDDYKTARISILLSEDEVSIPVTLTYADAFNQPLTTQVTIKVNRPSDSGSGVSGWLIAVLVVIVALGAWYLLRRRNRGRK